MKRLGYIFTIILFCCSCGVLKKQPQVQIQHDTIIEYKNNNIYQHDSIYIYKDRIINIKGDTVYVTETLFKDRWKIKEVHDTTYRDKIVEKVVTEEKIVEKELTWFQKTFIALGKIFSLLLILFIAYKLIKKKIL